MRRLILGIVALMVVSAAFGQMSLSNLRFSASSQPELDGNTIQADMAYSFSTSFASSVRLKRTATAKTQALDLGTDSASGKAIATSSQDNMSSDRTEVFLLPAEFTLSVLSPRGLTVGVGVYASFSETRDVGFFKLDTSIPSLSTLSVTNSYEGSSASQFYGPVLTLETEFSGGFFSFRPRIVVVPVFFYSEKDSLQIDPLLASAGKGEISYLSYGLPYLAVFGTGKLFGLIGIDVSYEISRQNAQLISTPDSGHASWWGSPKVVTNTSFRVVGNIIIPIGKGGELKLGAGPDFSASGIEGGASVTTTKPVFNIEYSINS